MRTRTVCLLILFFCVLACAAEPAYASIDYLARGVMRTVGAVFAIPKAMIEDSTQVLFPFGLVTGAVKGAVQTVSGILLGAVDLVRGAAPYAKYLVLFI